MSARKVFLLFGIMLVCWGCPKNTDVTTMTYFNASIVNNSGHNISIETGGDLQIVTPGDYESLNSSYIEHFSPSMLQTILLLENGESADWNYWVAHMSRTGKSDAPFWPRGYFVTKDTGFMTVTFDNVRQTIHQVGDLGRGPDMEFNYVVTKTKAHTFSAVYTFTEEDYDNATPIE